MPVLSTLGGASAFGFGLNRLAAAIGVVAADEYFANTVLLLNGENAVSGGQNNTFLDTSTNGHSITRNGNVTQGSFSPFSVDEGKWGVDFSASDANVRISDNADLNLTGEFTIELWARQDEYGPTANNRIFQRGVNSITGYCLLTSPTTKLVKFGRTDETIVGFTQDLSDGIWHHFAVTRDASNIVRLYFDGVLKDTATMSDTLNQSGDLFIGSYPGDASDRYSGSISNFRLVNGTALYTGSSLTVPTSPLTDVANTKVLTCLSNRFTDSSANGLTVTSYKNAKVVPFSPFPQTTAYTQSVVNQGSVKFDASTDKLTFTDTANDLDLGGTQASFECWYYPVALGAYQNMLVKYGGSIAWNTTTGIEYAISLNNGVFRIGYNDGDSSPSAVEDPTTRTAGQWYHFAVATDASNNIALFVNGTRVATGTNAITKPTTRTSIEIGSTNNEFLNGYLSNVRFITGSGAIDPTVTSFTVPTEPLTDIANTSLLTCQANGFVDNSSNAHTITVNGNPERTTNVPFGERSVEFDGSGDELITSGASIGDFGTGDFTIEAWVNPDLLSGYNSIIADDTYSSGSTPNAWCLYLDGTSLDGWKGGSSILTGGTLKVGQWHHVAWTRSSGTMYLFLDGVQVATASDSTSFNYGDIIVGSNVGNYHIEGYLSNVRIVKGTAVYTTDFTPPTEPLTAITNTSLLTCQNAVFQDNSGNAHAITANGDPQASTNLPFGERSVYFDGSGDYLAVASDTSLAVGTGDFTTEFWFYPTSVSGSTNIWDQRDGSNGWVVNFVSGQVGLYSEPSSAYVFQSSALSANVWYHIAVVRSGTDVTLYIDGVSTNTATNSSNFTEDAATIGARYTRDQQYFSGYITNARLVKGTAVYTAAFTPPTEPLTAVSGTSLLTCQDAVFQDNSGNAHAITVNGNAEASTNIPFAPVTTYGVQQYLDDAFTVSPQGGSGYFDGVDTDFLSGTMTADLALGTSDCTVECWIYCTGTSSSNDRIFDTRQGGATYGTDGFTFQKVGSNLQVWAGSYSAGAPLISGALGADVVNSWAHCRFSRVNGTNYLYINGNQIATNTNSWNQSFVSGRSFNVGKLVAFNGTFFDGYISDFRIIKSEGLSSNVPTAPLTPTSGTSLLCNFTNASILDATGKNVIETVGNAQVDTTTVKYGTGAMEFDGVSDYIDIPASPLFDFGTGDWTMECWFNTTSTTTDTFFRRMIMLDGPTGNATNNPQLTISSDGYVNGWTQTGDVDLRSSTGFNDGNWHHAAFVRDGGTLRLFVDGVQSATVATTATFSPNSGSPRPRIGNYNGSTGQGDWDGYIDDLRITKGIARYTANFTPPTAELPVIGEV